MDVTLVVIAGSKAGAKVAVKKSEFIIGRAKECNLCIGSSAISRRHCSIERIDNRVTVKDLGSRNGTLVNGQPTEGEVELASGDELTLGPLVFQVLISSGLKSGKQPQVKSVAEAAARTASQKQSEMREEEISDWLLSPLPLDGAPTLDAAAAISETKTIRLDETGTLPLTAQQSPANPPHGISSNSDPGAKSGGSPATSDESATPNTSKKSPKDSKGKLPLNAQPAAKDSREAAVQALRNWSRRR